MELKHIVVGHDTGSDVHMAVKAMSMLSNACNASIECDFNNKKIVVEPGSVVDDVVKKYLFEIRGDGATTIKYKDIGGPLVRVIEELSELTQALCKADRFGWFNCHPQRPNETNLNDVRREMDDVLETMNKLDIYMRELIFERFKDANTKRTHK